MIFCEGGGMRKRVSGDKCNEQPGGAGAVSRARDVTYWSLAVGDVPRQTLPPRQQICQTSQYGERVDSCCRTHSPRCLIKWCLNHRWQGWSLKCVHWTRGTTCLCTKKGKGSSSAGNFPGGQRWRADMWYLLLIYSRSTFDLLQAAH